MAIGEEMKKISSLDNAYGDNLPDQKPIKGVDTLEIFMNQAGMALEKAVLEKRLAELQKERK